MNNDFAPVESREELIEKARAAIHDAWSIRTMRPLEERPGLAETAAFAALAVFEQAHTPTDDEREALVKAITDTRVDAPSLYAGADGKWPLWDTGDEEPELIAESVLAAGFRRTVQGEPSVTVATKPAIDEVRKVLDYYADRIEQGGV